MSMDFSQIALLLSVAAVFGIVAKIFKQPLLIGYLFAGFLLSATGLIEHSRGLESMGQIGVALLLFLVGLEMNLSELPSIGKAAVLTGIGQIIFTSTVGFLLATLLGFASLPAVYIAIALTFSSTIIIVKLLSEKNDLNSLYGKISVGFLLVQDFVAVIILMFLASLGRGEMGANAYLMIVVKAIVLLVALWFLAKEVLPRFFSVFIDQSTELIFIASIGWALGVAALIGGPFGFSIEIGGFLAGLALSNLPEHLQVSSRTKPLRDFFLTIFFLMLGTNLIIGEVGSVIIPAVILSAFVLIGNPIIVLILMGLMGYKKRTSFLASVTVAQISEFSLILIALGASVGHVSQEVVSMVIIVGIITMTASTYMILGTNRLYEWLEVFLGVFEKKKLSEVTMKKQKVFRNHIVLVGADRTGSSIRRYLKSTKKDYVIVDFNPEIIDKLSKKKLDVIFGDINDDDVFQSAHVDKAALVISTTSNIHDNLTLLEKIRELKKKPYVVTRAASVAEAEKLYNAGATYVTVPQVLAGEHIRHLVKTYGVSKRLKKLGKGHQKRLAIN